MKICRECGSVNDNEVIYCIVCGHTKFDDAVEYKSEEEIPAVRKVIAPAEKSTKRISWIAVVAVVSAVCGILSNVLAQDNDIGNTTIINKKTSYTQTSYVPSTTATTTKNITTSFATTSITTTTTAHITTTHDNTTVIAPGLNSTQNGSMQISDDLRYSLNLFISNFTEANLKSFNYRPTDDELVKFGILYNTINENQRVETGEWTVNGEYYNRRISEEYIVSSINSHFCCQASNGVGHSRTDYWDGYFYMRFTGASVMGPMGVVTKLENLGNNRYRIYFNTYSNGGNNEGLYGYDNAYMAANSHYKASGTAVFQAADINNYYTYYLESYSI